MCSRFENRFVGSFNEQLLADSYYVCHEIGALGPSSAVFVKTQEEHEFSK